MSKQMFDCYTQNVNLVWLCLKCGMPDINSTIFDSSISSEEWWCLESWLLTFREFGVRKNSLKTASWTSMLMLLLDQRLFRISWPINQKCWFLPPRSWQWLGRCQNHNKIFPCHRCCLNNMPAFVATSGYAFFESVTWSTYVYPYQPTIYFYSIFTARRKLQASLDLHSGNLIKKFYQFNI